MGSCDANCFRLRDDNKYADVIEIGRFAHAQPQFCSTDHIPEEQYLGQGRIPHSGDSRQPRDPGHRAAESVSVNALFDLTPESSLPEIPVPTLTVRTNRD